MKFVQIFDSQISQQALDAVYAFVMAEIKKITSIHSERIPFTITVKELSSQIEDPAILEVRWNSFDDSQTAALQLLFRDGGVDLWKNRDDHLGFKDAAEALIIHFIKLYFSI